MGFSRLGSVAGVTSASQGSQGGWQINGGHDALLDKVADEFGVLAGPLDVATRFLDLAVHAQPPEATDIDDAVQQVVASLRRPGGGIATGGTTPGTGSASQGAFVPNAAAATAASAAPAAASQDAADSGDPFEDLVNLLRDTGIPPEQIERILQLLLAAINNDEDGMPDNAAPPLSAGAPVGGGAGASTASASSASPASMAPPSTTAAVAGQATTGAAADNGSAAAADTVPPGSGATGPSTDIGNGADPSIVQFNGEYWMAQADGGNTVTLAYAKTPEDLVHNAQHTEIHTDNPDFHAEAPSLAVTMVDGKPSLNVYVTNHLDGGQGTITALSVADPANAANPGTQDHGPLAGVSGYDSQFFTLPNGKSYMTYSQFDKIDMVEMRDPATPAGPPTTIFQSPDGSLAEAPAVVVSGNTINLAYSSGDYNSPNYNTSLLTASVDDPFSFQDRGHFLSGENGPAGAGSGTFFTGPDGNVMFGYGAYGADGRHIHLQPVAFDQDGKVLI